MLSSSMFRYFCCLSLLCVMFICSAASTCWVVCIIMFVCDCIMQESLKCYSTVLFSVAFLSHDARLAPYNAFVVSFCLSVASRSSIKVLYICNGWRMEIQTSNLVCLLYLRSPSPQMTNHAWKGRGQMMWTIYILGGTSHISGTAEARVVKFCILVGYVMS